MGLPPVVQKYLHFLGTIDVGGGDGGGVEV